MKFTSIITALLFASAQSAAVRDADERRKLGLGNKPSRRMEEVAAAMGGGGGGSGGSCAAENPVIAVEQVALAALTTKAIMLITKGKALYLNFIPSLLSMLDNADFVECNPLVWIELGTLSIKPIKLGLCINKIYAEMSCEEYIEQKEASILIDNVLPQFEIEVDLFNVNGVADPQELTLDDLTPETEGTVGLAEYITSAAAAAEAEASEAEADGDSSV